MAAFPVSFSVIINRWMNRVGTSRVNDNMRRLLILAMPAFLALALSRPAARAWDIDAKYSEPKTVTTDTGWHPDILSGYEARYVDQGIQFDGPCRSTIVRLKAKKPTRRGFLYIHGFNDYFFQSEMGQRFVDSGYHFYAVDLRRYGRSNEPWQYPYNIRDMRKYYADIDSAVAQMKRDGIDDITLGGHSTGDSPSYPTASTRERISRSAG